MSVLQFESIANFGAVIDRLGEFQEVLESSSMSRSTIADVPESESASSHKQSLIHLVDQPGAKPTQSYCSEIGLSHNSLFEIKFGAQEYAAISTVLS